MDSLSKLIFIFIAMDQKRKRSEQEQKPIPPSFSLYRPPDDTAIQVANFLKYMISKSMEKMKLLKESPNVVDVSIEVDSFH
jgi:hypothetical protein